MCCSAKSSPGTSSKQWGSALRSRRACSRRRPQAAGDDRPGTCNFGPAAAGAVAWCAITGELCQGWDQAMDCLQVQRAALDGMCGDDRDVQAATRGSHNLGLVPERHVVGKRLGHLWEVDVDAGNLVRPDADVCSQPSQPPSCSSWWHRARLTGTGLAQRFPSCCYSPSPAIAGP